MSYNPLILLATALLITSCTKSSDRHYAAGWKDNNPAGSPEVRQFLDKQARVAQRFTIDPTRSNTVVTREGISFDIPAGILYTNNNVIATPPVTIAITEYFTNSDLLTSNVSTATTDGKILNTGGAFHIEATSSSGEALKINSPIIVKVPIRGNYDPAYLQFPGLDNGATTNLPNRVLWKTDTLRDIPRLDSNYRLVLRSLSWCNVDKYIQDLGQGMSQLNVKLPADFGNSNTLVALIFPNNGCVRLTGDPVSETFTAGFYKLPVGLPLKLLAIANVNGAYFYDYRAITIGKTNMITIPSLTPITETALADFIENGL